MVPPMRVSALVRRGWCLAFVCLAWQVFSGTAQAGGVEYVGAGTRVLGRGGAYHVRADDPLALLFNPANLAVMPGAQLTLQANNAFQTACFRRSLVREAEGSDYTALTPPSDFTSFDGAGDAFPGESWGGTPIPEVCQENLFQPTANLAASFRLADDWGLGFGIVAPAAVGGKRWGEGDGSVVAPGGTRVPSPGRYSLTEENLLIVYPTVSVGFQPLPWLRIGAGFSWGLGVFNIANVVREFPLNEAPDGDALAQLEMSDFFIPAVVGSVVAEPVEWMDVALGFRWADGVSAGGTLNLETSTFGVGQEGVAGRPSRSPVSNPFEGSALEFKQPWMLWFGVRFHDPIPELERPDVDATVANLGAPVRDRMATERWDVELNVRYEASSELDDIRILVPEGSSARIAFVDGMGTRRETRLSIPSLITIPHRWSDQLSIRLGGDWNVVPGLFAVRAGASFETQGVNDAFAGLDFLPGMRLGLHVGATVRLGGRLDLSIAYAHMFQWDIEVTRQEANLAAVSASSTMPGLVVDGTDRVVNAGTYEVGMNVLSLGLNWHI